MAGTSEQDWGKRLLPTTIDEIAAHDPDRVWVLIPKSRDLAKDGYREVKFATLANAINVLAGFIRDRLGVSKTLETIAYLGKPDIRYNMLVMAASKNGYQMLLSSHMNSLAAHLNLIRKTSCRTMLSSSGVDVSDILQGEKMKHVIIPELEELLDSAKVDTFKFPKTFEEAKLDPYLILHTSGSTGLPKPVIFNHNTYAKLDAQRSLPKEEPEIGFSRMCYDDLWAGRIMATFAPFHGIGQGILFPQTVFGRTILVCGQPDRMISLQDAKDMLKYADINMLFAPPYLVRELVDENEDWILQRLAKLQHVAYGGGALPVPIAEKLLSHGVKLINSWGTTETMAKVKGWLPPEDWQYLCFHPKYNGMDLRLAAKDGSESGGGRGLYHMYLVRSPKAEPYSMFFARCLDVNEYDIGDLWEKHPTRPNTWRHAGRADELIVTAMGLNIHPNGIQSKLNAHPYISTTMLVGTKHEQLVVIIDLSEAGLHDSAKLSDHHVKDEIWKLVEDINAVSQKIARIDRDHIIYAKKEKPLPKTAKGTIQKAEAMKVYGSEIDETYAKYGDHGAELMDRVQTNGHA